MLIANCHLDSYPVITNNKNTMLSNQDSHVTPEHPDSIQPGITSAGNIGHALSQANRQKRKMPTKEALLTELVERTRAEQVARGQTEALAKTLDLLAAEPELDSFVGQVLKALTEQLNSLAGSFWLYDAVLDLPLLRLDYNNKMASPVIYEGQIRKFDGHVKALNQNGPVRSMELQVFDDIGAAPLDQQYRDELLASGIQTLIVVPLVSGTDLIGSFTLIDSDRRHYRPEELELAQALAQQAVLAIQLTRLAEHKRKAAVLEERNRIAREIHDTLAQAFTGILLQLRVAQRIADKRPTEAWSLVEQVSEMAHQGLVEARRSVWDLQPEAMEYRDIVAALTKHTGRLSLDSTALIELRVHGAPRDLTPSVGMDLVRIAQEALTNSVRHSGASIIGVDITFGSDEVMLNIQDDGTGFDVKRKTEAGGFGLIGMNQRAERLGGRLTITTNADLGTEVAVSVPNTAAGV